MAQEYTHLTFEREQRRNDRRPASMTLPSRKHSDIAAHSGKLKKETIAAVAHAKSQIKAGQDGFILKFRYVGSLDFAHLGKHGVEFLSQEGNEVCVVFADEAGLAIFSQHLEMLGNGEKVTYRQILEALDGVENWSSEDRTSWAIKNKGLPQLKKFRLDIELWPIHVANHPTRIAVYQKFEDWLRKESIAKIDRINLDSLLMYRVEVENSQVDLLLNHRDIRQVDLTPVSGISFQELNVDIEELPKNIPSPPRDAARVCILDSGINTNHPLISPAIGDSESFVEGGNTDDDAGHGTAVAGIALYGDLEACKESNYWHPEIWILNGKILECDDHGNAIFNEETIENKIERAVTHFHKTYNCRIFNLSIGNLNAPYDGKHVKGMAYLLDRLSRQLDILFIVSAGNFSGNEDPPVPVDSWREEYPEYLLSPVSTIIDPAPSLCSITVGSLARHNANIDELRYPEISALSPASENQPSPFTRHGPSVKGALKPEIMAIGGNLASPMRKDGKQWQANMRGLGVLTLNSNFVGSTLLKEISGTSFAAPYLTHLAGRLLNQYPDASANLLRAMIVNHCKLPNECEETFPEAARKAYKKERRRDLPREVCGYGSVDEDILFRSTETSALVFAEESIENDTHQFYELPLPESFFRRGNSARELRVSLAHTPATRTTRLEYVSTEIWFRLVRANSLDEAQRYFNKETKDQYETRSDDCSQLRTISTLVRDKGTVQFSSWAFQKQTLNSKWFVVVTRQDRPWAGGIATQRENYALVVTATDRENQEANLYTEMKAVLNARAEIRNKARGRVR